MNTQISVESYVNRQLIKSRSRRGIPKLFLAEIVSPFFVFCSATGKELWIQETIHLSKLLLKDLLRQHSQEPSMSGKRKTAIALAAWP